MIKKYIDYLKDNPQGYWFKARLYGWGWIPMKWQGWVVVACFVVVLLLNGFYFDSKIPTGSDPRVVDLVIFFGVLLVSITILFSICYKKGEKPRWQWGPPKDKIK
ncbi:MAG: hypothetical protein UT30_C0013G0011 [Candidatus Uhrbacteria bacterium GW2011_GWF2_39_13]|uniref:Uncharacterized protein n=1 Tax=Candidatus Uhrbacteria bacterium GW2011_GWF2_39_13 TaxID=1618995 RepID=A0A0G0Q0X0_9BACT|nr:MAG: hypothetical protein UT30_C0013G0011 [Candidatus Uhrbacteria bacterium GW2011_GWF2_39_13]HAU66210.1 hypothetical protein [Candidatus Uhrbacteria bacterium]